MYQDPGDKNQQPHKRARHTFCIKGSPAEELTDKKDILFIIGDWNAKVGSQEIPGVMGKFGVGIQNEARQRLVEFCQENALV